LKYIDFTVPSYSFFYLSQIHGVGSKINLNPTRCSVKWFHYCI